MTVSQETHWEDQMINAAVEALERGADPSAAAPWPVETAETAETLARLYMEVLGLIPYELAPAAPHPETRQRLLAAVTAVSGASVRAAAPRPVVTPVPPPPSPPAPAQPPAPAPTPAVGPRAVEPLPAAPVPAAAGPLSGARRLPPRPAPLSPARRPLGWPGVLAAGVTLALLGLSGWLYLQHADQAETIAHLQRALTEARQKEAQATQQAERFRTDYTQLRTTMTLVTPPAALVCPLRPVGQLQRDARGALFVAADHQHWHLSIEGLKPPSPGKVYQLWFVPEQGPPVNGGTFLATADERIEMSSEAMPAGTKSAMVTLENAPAAPAPSGPEVLRAAPMFQVL